MTRWVLPQSNPLHIVFNRMSCKKDRPGTNLPWTVRCGCGTVANCRDGEGAIRYIRRHRCDDFHS